MLTCDVGSNHTPNNHQLWTQVSVNDSVPAGPINQRWPFLSPLFRLFVSAGDNTACPVCADRELQLYTALCTEKGIMKWKRIL